MTARSGIGDAPQCQKEVRCVTGRDRSHRVFNHRRYTQRLLGFPIGMEHVRYLFHSYTYCISRRNFFGDKQLRVL